MGRPFRLCRPDLRFHRQKHRPHCRRFRPRFHHCTGGAPRRDLLDKRNSQDLEHLMEQRKPYRYAAGDAKLRASESSDRYFLGVAAPIIAEGDLMGCVMLLMEDKDDPWGGADQKLAQTIASFLGPADGRLIPRPKPDTRQTERHGLPGCFSISKRRSAAGQIPGHSGSVWTTGRQNAHTPPPRAASGARATRNPWAGSGSAAQPSRWQSPRGICRRSW